MFPPQAVCIAPLLLLLCPVPALGSGALSCHCLRSLPARLPVLRFVQLPMLGAFRVIGNGRTWATTEVRSVRLQVTPPRPVACTLTHPGQIWNRQHRLVLVVRASRIMLTLRVARAAGAAVRAMARAGQAVTTVLRVVLEESAMVNVLLRRGWQQTAEDRCPSAVRVLWSTSRAA